MSTLFALLCLGASAVVEAREDASALVQASVQAHRTRASVHVGDGVVEDDEGPMAYTKLGPVRGKRGEGYNLFAGIPYAEPPERFEPSQPKKPWAPEVLNATRFRSTCIGAQVGEHESEDCLFLQAWVPQGGHKNMPVIVYFHGGINQHGGGFEGLRRGDFIVQNEKYPTIFINFDWRLGVLGWIDLKGSNITANLGFMDQQAALRWVHENIAAFGGDPSRVTLQGQSEGCGIILNHMTSPGSEGLFQRAALHSPVADMWSRFANHDRTAFVIQESGCKRKEIWSTIRCLKRKTPMHLWHRDWTSESLSRNMLSPTWTTTLFQLLKYYGQSEHKAQIAGMLGWHPTIDGVNIPGEARELIRSGKFQKIPVLMTVSPNETYGVIPNGMAIAAKVGLQFTMNTSNSQKVLEEYVNVTLKTGVNFTDPAQWVNAMLTDKIWTCDARSLANEIYKNGGKAYMGTFWHKPKYAPVGRSTSPICEKGATCHADEMLYVLPQGPRFGIHGKGMEQEKEFAHRYVSSFLAFVHGKDSEHPWAAWDDTHPITFYDSEGARVQRNYRQEQCDVLAKSDGQTMPRVNWHTAESRARGHI